MINPTKEEIEENRQLWLQALRSGKYKQIKGFLKNQLGHCCLGVACEVLKDKLNLSESIESPNNFSRFNGNAACLPSAVYIALGLNSCEGCFYLEGTPTCLTSLNDRGLSFENIADIIESNNQIFI